MGLRSFVKKLRNKSQPHCAAVVAAAGNSARMGGNKLLMDLGGVPVLCRTLQALDKATLVDEIVVAARDEDMLTVAELCAKAGLHKAIKVVKGGATRAESVLCAALECGEKTEIIAVHDGARPLVKPEEIDRLILLGNKTNAVAPALPVKDTVKVADENGLVKSTPDRATLFAVQTPQIFQADLLKAALQSSLQNKVDITDDCSAVERLGKEVYLTDGDPENMKITTPVDLIFAEAILRKRGQV